MAACQKILRANHGCTTPFENFFYSLVLRAIWAGQSPTPDDVEKELAKFREEWEDMKSEVAAFMTAYPEVQFSPKRKPGLVVMAQAEHGREPSGECPAGA